MQMTDCNYLGKIFHQDKLKHNTTQIKGDKNCICSTMIHITMSNRHESNAQIRIKITSHS